MLNNAEYIFRQYLMPGERLLWASKAFPRKGFQPGDIFVIVFMLFWTGFALFWETMAIGMLINTFANKSGQNAPVCFAVIFPLFGLPFVGIGVYMLAHKFYFEKKIRNNTYYALTDKRILFTSGLNERSMKFESINLEGIRDLKIQMDADGTGSIEILDIRMLAAGSRLRSGSRPIVKDGHGPSGGMIIDSVPDPMRVYQLIQDSVARLKSGETTDRDETEG